MPTVADKLHDLETETLKLLDLLRVRHDNGVGPMWGRFLNERLRAMQKLIDEAIGPSTDQP